MTHDYMKWLKDRYRQWGKPIVFNELGYPSNKEALVSPFSSYSPTGTVDTDVQARAYCAAFQALAGKPWVKGIYVWQWYWNDSSIKPATDMDQSPQNKPAEAVIRAWFSATAPEPDLEAPNRDPPPARPSRRRGWRAAAPGVLPAPRVRLAARRPRRTTTSLRLAQRPSAVRHHVRADRASRAAHVAAPSSSPSPGGRHLRPRARRACAEPQALRLDGTFAATMRLPKGLAWRVQAEFRGTAGTPRRPVGRAPAANLTPAQRPIRGRVALPWNGARGKGAIEASGDDAPGVGAASPDPKVIDPIDDPRWLQFVEAEPNATIFHHPALARAAARSVPLLVHRTVPRRIEPGTSWPACPSPG